MIAEIPPFFQEKHKVPPALTDIILKMEEAKSNKKEGLDASLFYFLLLFLHLNLDSYISYY